MYFLIGDSYPRFLVSGGEYIGVLKSLSESGNLEAFMDIIDKMTTIDQI